MRADRVCALLCALILGACGDTPVEENPLPGWRDGPARSAVLDWLDAVTTPGSDAFRPEAERIAVFDHDGTLIVERPLVQMAFISDRVRLLAPDNPEWQNTEPFARLLAAEPGTVPELGIRERGPLMQAAQAGLTLDKYDQLVAEFLARATHPRFGRPYRQLYYAPMKQLVALLQARGFAVYIVSGGGVHFIRGLSSSAYGIPPENVIGSRAKTSLREIDGQLDVVRRPGFASLNVGRFKALNIRDIIGRRPILAVGNSDGDIEMMKFAESNGSGLVLLLRHDDADREYAYDDDAESVNTLAMERGWQAVSMRDDFRYLFAQRLQ